MTLPEFELIDKVAVVTGASRNIGRATALQMARAGANVVVASRTPQALDDVAGLIRAMGRRAAAIPCDITKRQEVENLVATTIAEFGRIDILVNNAGVFQPWYQAEDVPEEEWDRVINTDLKGVFLCSQAIGKVMIEQRDGVILNVSSISGKVALPKRCSYNVAKAGLLALTQSLAVDWAAYNIRVNAVAPAFIERENEALKAHPEVYQWVINRTPLGRFGKLEEVANTLVFLASPGAGYITGATIMVDGGWTAM